MKRKRNADEEKAIPIIFHFSQRSNSFLCLSCFVPCLKLAWLELKVSLVHVHVASHRFEAASSCHNSHYNGKVDKTNYNRHLQFYNAAIASWTNSGKQRSSNSAGSVHKFREFHTIFNFWQARLRLLSLSKSKQRGHLRRMWDKESRTSYGLEREDPR